MQIVLKCTDLKFAETTVSSCVACAGGITLSLGLALKDFAATLRGLPNRLALEVRACAGTATLSRLLHLLGPSHVLHSLKLTKNKDRM